MPSLSLKKLFKSKKDKESDNDNRKTKISRTSKTSGAKFRLASFTSTFRRRTRLDPATAEPQRDAIFGNQITDVVPLPSIPRVASTLRRDLARFKTLLLDNPLARSTILRKPVSLGYASNHRTPADGSPLAKSTIRRKPEPVSEVTNNHFFCPRTLEENGSTPIVEGASAIDHPSTADFIPLKHDSPSALITASDAAASQPCSPTLSSSPSCIISFSEFPLPPAFLRIQQTAPVALYHANASIQIAHDAVYAAPTASDAQQGLLDLADASATNITSTTHNNDAANSHGRESPGGTVRTVYAPVIQDEWTPVEAECASLTRTVGQFRQRRMSHDARRQNGVIRALQSNKAKAVAENEGLTLDLAATNAMVRVERAKKEEFLRRFEEAHDAHSRIYKQKARLTEERDIARNMAEESADAAKSSNDHNKELSGKIASREYHVCQAKIVLERTENFKLRTGHSPEEWHERAMAFAQANSDLHNRHQDCEANVANLTSQLTETAGVLVETTKALKKSDTEAWTFKHLHEEAGRTLELSQRMHKQANEVVSSLQKQVGTQEFSFNIERRCAERLLADAMRENATKGEHIARLRDVLATAPETEETKAKLLDMTMLQLTKSDEETISAQRAAADALELLTAEEAKSEAHLQAHRELDDKLGQVQMEFDISEEDKARLKEELVDAYRDLDVAVENARLWQVVAEQRLDDLSPDEKTEIKAHALQQVRKQLEQAQEEARYYQDKNQMVREDAADLEYELYLHQRRLSNDAGQELHFYQTHWETVKEIFEENMGNRALVNAMKERFAADLEKEPLVLSNSTLVHDTFEEAVGADFVAQTLAMFKGQWSSHFPEKPCLKEKIQGVYGFGPAGPPSDGGKFLDMPEGYLERRVTRQGMDGEGGCEGEWEDVEELELEQV